MDLEIINMIAKAMFLLLLLSNIIVVIPNACNLIWVLRLLQQSYRGHIIGLGWTKKIITMDDAHNPYDYEDVIDENLHGRNVAPSPMDFKTKRLL